MGSGSGDGLTVVIAVAALLSLLMSIGLNVRRQEADRRAGRRPKRSDRISLVLYVCFGVVLVGALLWIALG